MEKEKEIVTSGKVTGELIGNYIAFTIIAGIITKFIWAAIEGSGEGLSFQMTLVVTLLLEIITVFLVWFISMSSTFKKKTIYRNEIGKVVKNLIIFTVIILVIGIGIDVSKLNSEFNKAIDENSELNMLDKYVSLTLSEEEQLQYQIEKDKAIKETKQEMYTYFIAAEVGVVIIDLGMLFFVKKKLEKYAVEE